MDRKYFSIGKIVSTSFLFSVFFGIATTNAEPPAPPPPPPLGSLPPPPPPLVGLKKKMLPYEECIKSPNFIPGCFKRKSLPANIFGLPVDDYVSGQEVFMIDQGQEVAPRAVIESIINQMKEDLLHTDKINPNEIGIDQPEKKKRDGRKKEAEDFKLTRYANFYKKCEGNGEAVRSAMKDYIEKQFSLENYREPLFNCGEGSLVQILATGDVLCLKRNKKGLFFWDKVSQDPAKIRTKTMAVKATKEGNVIPSGSDRIASARLKGDVVFKGKLREFSSLTLNELEEFTNLRFIPNLYDIVMKKLGIASNSEQSDENEGEEPLIYYGKSDGEIKKVGASSWYKWVKNRWVPGQENEYVWIETDAPEGAKSFAPERSATSHPTHSAGNAIPDNWLRKSRPLTQPSISLHPEADQRSNLLQEIQNQERGSLRKVMKIQEKHGDRVGKVVDNDRSESASVKGSIGVQTFEQTVSKSVMESKGSPVPDKKSEYEMKQEPEKTSSPKLKSTKQPVIREEQTNGMDPQIFKILQNMRGMSS